MTRAELKQAAIDCLGEAFKGDTSVEVHVVQAAVSIVLSPDPQTTSKKEKR